MNSRSAGLTPKQLELVQTSWEQVEPVADTAADIFYTRMFSTEPSYRKLFPEDMAKQKKALMKMLGMAVKGITNLDELIPKVQELGRRHAKVGDSLLFCTRSFLKKKMHPASTTGTRFCLLHVGLYFLRPSCSSITK